MPESASEKREKNLKAADDNRKQYEDTVRRMRARLDRTSLSSSSRRPLEKAFEKLIRQGPALADEFNENDDA